jgi:hypothetical protein
MIHSGNYVTEDFSLKWAVPLHKTCRTMISPTLTEYTMNLARNTSQFLVRLSLLLMQQRLHVSGFRFAPPQLTLGKKPSDKNVNSCYE